MGKPQVLLKVKPAWDKRGAIEKARTKQLNQLSKLKKLHARLKTQGKAKPLDIRDNVEALERELQGSGSSSSQLAQQQQQQWEALATTIGRHEPEPEAKGRKDMHETGLSMGGSKLKQEQKPGPPHKRQQQQHLVGHKSPRDEHSSFSPTEQIKQQQHQLQQQHKQKPQQPLEQHKQQQQQQQQQQQLVQGGQMNINHEGVQASHELPNARRRQRPPGKPTSKTQRLALANEARKAEALQAKQQAQKARAEHQAKVEQSKKARGKEKQKFFKKTKRGQPVMKYRMDKVLEALQKQ